jgi:heme oxygenase
MSSAARKLPSVRERLREATAEIHQALHHARPFARIADGTLDRDGYGRVLLMLHRYHASMAEHCAVGAEALGAPRLARAHLVRIQALESDLNALGLTPQITVAQTARDGSFSIGCLYTVQGSTLGGKVIYRQLDRLLPGDDGRSFFEGTADDGALWQSLCAGLENCTGDAHLAQMKEGAHYAFQQFDRFLKD